MSVQRYVDTGFWDDAWVETIQPLERYLYLYLITNPLTNIAGVYKITLRRIHNDTGLEIPEIERILALFAKAGKAYLHGEYIVLPAWPKHQRLESRKTIKLGIDRIIESLDAELLTFLGQVGYRYDTPRIPLSHRETPLSYPYPTSYSDSDSDSDTDTDTDSDSDRKTSPELSTSGEEGKRVVEEALESGRITIDQTAEEF